MEITLQAFFTKSTTFFLKSNYCFSTIYIFTCFNPCSCRWHVTYYVHAIPTVSLVYQLHLYADDSTSAYPQMSIISLIYLTCLPFSLIFGFFFFHIAVSTDFNTVIIIKLIITITESILLEKKYIFTKIQGRGRVVTQTTH